MRLLVTGGTGFIGQHLIKKRLAAGDSIVCWSRDPAKVHDLFGQKVEAIRDLPEKDELQIDAIVNLAGEPIADKRWSFERKQLLRASRIDLTHQLVEWVKAQDQKPEVLVSGSAIGFYGCHSSDVQLGENSAVSPGFTHDLCADWETEAIRLEEDGVRVCLLRTGVVLGHGGALSKMLLPFKLGLGGPIASGQQWMSWIHIEDEVEVIEMLLTHQHLQGAFNLTAPEAVPNRVFTGCLAKALKRPAFLPMPAFVIDLMLGEGAELLVQGQRVYPEKLLEIGYQFKYPELQPALNAIVR
ncbi:TIGR01777 family oxidoreductase [Neptuniibacter caesariensis]|uniref:TIGR01777 family protein n=1 Tax=Neptuniibacter caesariensis TaxID=207954 RepID=A0A7U8GR55_NEPCE|nr:TIGR01777 family oxidoreductase [Neptuniibacter caesariensis]EAR59830.1 hypothetical protein MED92_12621 [Neptuniibacter caesariensis]